MQINVSRQKPPNWAQNSFSAASLDSFTAYHGWIGWIRWIGRGRSVPISRRHLAKHIFITIIYHSIVSWSQQSANKSVNIINLMEISTGFYTLIADGIRPITCPQHPKYWRENLHFIHCLKRNGKFLLPPTRIRLVWKHSKWVIVRERWDGNWKNGWPPPVEFSLWGLNPNNQRSAFELAICYNSANATD